MLGSKALRFDIRHIRTDFYRRFAHAHELPRPMSLVLLVFACALQLFAASNLPAVELLADESKVTKANADKIKAGMMVKEVEEILGPGKEMQLTNQFPDGPDSDPATVVSAPSSKSSTREGRRINGKTAKKQSSSFLQTARSLSPRPGILETMTQPIPRKSETSFGSDCEDSQSFLEIP